MMTSFFYSMDKEVGHAKLSPAPSYIIRRMRIGTAKARWAEVAVERSAADNGGGVGDEPQHHKTVEKVVLQLLPPWPVMD